MLKELGAVAVIAVSSFNAEAADKLPSFDHAAELTTQARTIIWQELASSGAENAYHQQITCLAENIYFEARGESFKAKIAVANVTRNRVEDHRWPSTYCEVIQQGPVRESWKTKQNNDLLPSERVYYPVKHRCQFSWYCDGQADIIWANMEQSGEIIEGNARAWRESVRISIAALGQGDYFIHDNTHNATHYYNHNLVTPSWSRKLETTTIVGNHTFQK
tara:strand:+ start:1074 stop:1730 length:657 start_codon:yes stop_codon:yes gene_type:complete